MDTADFTVNKLIEMVMAYLPKLAMAILVLVVGFWVLKRLKKILSRAFSRTLNPDITPFLVTLVDGALKVLLFFSVAELVGIETASFLAVLAAAGFAIGLALQGSLSNFAAGIILLILKPYRVNDWVEIDGKFGCVNEIQIFNTILTTPGQKTLHIPNGKIIENVITNFSTKGLTRLELRVTMPYSESFPKVKQIIEDTLKTIPEVLEEPVSEIGIESYDSHTIIVAVRPYVHPDVYWPVTFNCYEAIKKAFHDNNIQVAYSEGVELGTIGA